MFWNRVFKVRLIKESIKKMSDVELLIAYEISRVTLRNVGMLRLLLGKGKECSKLERRYRRVEKTTAVLLKELWFIIKRRGLEHKILKGGQ